MSKQVLLETGSFDEAIAFIDTQFNCGDAVALVNKEEYERGPYWSAIIESNKMYVLWRDVARHYTENATSFRVIKDLVKTKDSEYVVIALVYWPR